VEQNLANLKTQYEYQRDSVSGVDVNEELLNMAKYQKSYEAAVRVVRTIETMLDELFRVAG
jgi:flagellar hook-associated protein 1 FlgK